MSPQIDWLGHASFRISGEKTVYIDPWQLEETHPAAADIILITHGHRDHLSQDDIAKIVQEGTTIVTTASCAAQLHLDNEVIVVAAGDQLTVQDVAVEVVPAYNTNKFREEGTAYHPQEAGGVGFIVTLDGQRVYHSGDTDFIPEIENINIDVALLPVSGKAVMTAEEAAAVVEKLRPELAIPMHYGSIMGSVEDADRFKALAAVPVQILEKRN